jgi:hypothetical protein
MDTNSVFYWCVDILRYYAHKLGTTYEAINVWIFCVIEPIVFLIMLYVIIRQAKRIKRLKQSYNVK